MYVTTSHPAEDLGLADSGPRTLSLALAVHHLAGPGRPFVDHDHDYFTDLLTTHGLTLDEERFAAGRNSYTDLVSALVPEMGRYRDRFDLAMMVSAAPDAEPGWPMCFLTEVVAAPGLAFAIADQGVMAPFTALRLATDWARAGTARRILLFALDQASVLHDGPVPDHLRVVEDSGVLLVFDIDAEPQGRLEARRPQRMRPEAVPGGWSALLGEAHATTDLPVTAVAGTGLAGALGNAAERLDVPPGRPATGMWAVLVEGLPTWRAEGRRVLMADYDPDLGRLSSCLIDIEPVRGEEARS